MDCRRDYRTLVDLCWTAMQARAGEKLTTDTAWLYDSERISRKLVYHLETAWLVASGVPVPASVTPSGNGPLSFVDFTSLSVVLRAAFETYLTLYHLFVDPAVPEAERQFRHRMWELGGLRDRQSYPASQPENREKLASEAARIEELRREITADDVYERLSKSEQEKARKGEWRLKQKWEDLAASADQHRRWFAQIYRYLCGHSHTSYISTLQLSQAGPAEQQRFVQSLLDVGCLLTSHFLTSYARLSDRVREALRADGDRRLALERWYISADQMERWYREEQG